MNLIAWTEVTDEVLNIYKQPCRLKACIFALCVEGSISVSINLMGTEIKQGDFITLLPGTIIQFNGQKEKVRVAFVGFSSQCVTGVNLIQSTLTSFPILLEYPVITLNETIASYIKDYFALLARVSTGPYPPGTRMAQQILQSFLQKVDILYNIQPRKERRAQFYADRLGISLQHLSTTVKQVTGRNLLDIIAGVVLMDVKAKLKSTDMTVQEIAYSLNFPSASFFGKYFKRYMGMSPLEYRNS